MSRILTSRVKARRIALMPAGGRFDTQFRSGRVRVSGRLRRWSPVETSRVGSRSRDTQERVGHSCRNII